MIVARSTDVIELQDFGSNSTPVQMENVLTAQLFVRVQMKFPFRKVLFQVDTNIKGYN